MKTVSGEVVSSKSMSLRKAAKTLSNFASSDNGASPAFSAYLKRAVASFYEIVQLHKEFKSSGSECKVKKQRSMYIPSEGTGGSVINGVYEGLVKESQWVNKSEGEAGRIDVRTKVQKAEGIVDGNVVDVRGAGKKSKKKREDNEAVTFKNEPSDDFDAINMKGLKNETNYRDLSKDKKKNGQPYSDRSHKQQKHKNGQPYSDHASINDIKVKNEIESFDRSIEMKKKNKNKVDIKEKRVSSGINGDEQSYEIRGNVENADKDKRSHVGKERKKEGKLEINDSRKRKHESITAKELDDQQEKHKSKKKKR